MPRNAANTVTKTKAYKKAKKRLFEVIRMKVDRPNNSLSEKEVLILRALRKNTGASFVELGYVLGMSHNTARNAHDGLRHYAKPAVNQGETEKPDVAG